MTKLYFNKEYLAYLIMKKQIINLHHFAAEMGVEYNTVIRWRNGEIKPRIESVNKIAKYFKIKLEALYKPCNTDIYNKRLNDKFTKEFLNEN